MPELDAQTLLKRLQYPGVWQERGLITDELVAVQAAEFSKDAQEHGQRVEDYIPSGGTEHYRYGAFWYWFRKNPDVEQLNDLLDAALADPDSGMAGSALRDIISFEHATSRMLDLAVERIATTEGSWTPEEFRAYFRSGKGG